MNNQVIAYIPDSIGDAVCPDCTTDEEKEEIIAVVILRSDEWAHEAVHHGVKCARCPKVWTGSTAEGDWE